VRAPKGYELDWALIIQGSIRFFDVFLGTLASGEEIPDLFGMEQGQFPRYMEGGIIEQKFVDLTDRVDETGRLDWDIPAGDWTIMRFVCANTGLALRLPSPNSGGLAIDHFSADATRFHFNYLLDKLHAELGDFRDTALKQLYVCSYELSGSTWTPEFLAQFERRRGYDMTRFLPVLAGCVVRDHETTARFRYDYRKTLGDLLVDAFYKTATELSNEHGLKLCAEAGGPGPPLHQVPVDALKAQGTLDIPRGEFWKEHNVWVVKETACAAHIYGKSLVDMEAFTSWRHWQDGPFELKPIADRAFCDGANHFTFHTSAHNSSATDRPGWVYHAGTHISPSIAWWPKAKPWIDYLARCSYMLQQGLFVADICYFYGENGPSSVYYYVPNVKVRLRDVWFGAVLAGLLWRGALWGFSLYMRDLSRYSIEGSVASIMVFLMWVYLSAVILLYGVEVTAAYARLRRHRRPDEPAAAQLEA